MLKFIQNNREITALLAVVLLFVLPGFLNRQYLSVQTLTMVYSSAQILILLDVYKRQIVTRNQHIDLVAGITVIGMIKDKNAFAKTKLHFRRIGDKPGICRRLTVSSTNV